MTLHFILKYGHALISALLILCILVQNRSSGLSAAMGGNGVVRVQKRGAEKVIYRATIVFSVFFVLGALAFLFVR